MNQNPFAIKPGEFLTHQELFERFLSYVDYERRNKIDLRKKRCRKNLFYSHLCCQTHMQVASEYASFFRYFHLLDMIGRDAQGFSINSMIWVINRYKLAITDDLKSKIKIYFGSNSDLFFEELEKLGL